MPLQSDKIDIHYLFHVRALIQLNFAIWNYHFCMICKSALSALGKCYHSRSFENKPEIVAPNGKMKSNNSSSIYHPVNPFLDWAIMLPC